MTNEKREAIEYLERQIRVCNENAEICDDNNFDEEATHLREESYMLDTVLSLIKAQQEEISKYKTLYERALSDVVKTDIYERALSDVVKTDKQIDLMAEIFYKRFKAELLLEYGFESKKEIKQYFERKVEDVKD